MHRRNRRQAKINDELNENIRDLREKYSQLHIHYDNAMLTNKAPQDEAVDMPQAHREFLEQTVDIINELFSKESVSVETISQRMNMSPYQFRQRLQSITGETPQSFIQTVRMRRARYLLDNHPELNISEVSRLCAYGDVPSFTRAFKNAFGMTPSKYLGR
jgi:AraC-like DNA-binding protein